MSVTVIWLLVAVGLLMGVIYALVVAVKSVTRMSNRTIENNKQLMVMLAQRDGGNDAARAVLASQRKPKCELPGVAEKKGKKKEQPPQKETPKGDCAFHIQVP